MIKIVAYFAEDAVCASPHPTGCIKSICGHWLF